MKTINKKSKISVLLCLAFAFVSMLCFTFTFAPKIALAENAGAKIQINFVNSGDKVMNGETEYNGEIYYNQTDNKLENANGDELNLTVVCADGLFSAWNVYNTAEENGFETLGTEYASSFDLKLLVSNIYADENKDKYLFGGQISLLSIRSANSTEFKLDASVETFGKLFVSGVLVKNKIDLYQGEEYDIKVVSVAHYAIKSVKVYTGLNLEQGKEPSKTSTEGEFKFETLGVSSHTVAVEYEKVKYTINFLAVNRNMAEIENFDKNAHLSTLATIGKVDEAFGIKLTISSDNDYRYFACRLFNNETEQYDDFDLLSIQENNQTMDADFYAKYAKNGVVNVNIIFDKLYKVEVAGSENGQIVAYINEVAVDENKYVNGKLTVYVSAIEKLEIYALADEGYVVSDIERVSKFEVENNKITLSSLNQNRDIKINFEKDFYVLEVYAVDGNDERLSHYDANSMIYVNGQKSNRVRLGDIITRIDTVVGSLNADYKIEKYQIYNQTNSAFEDYVLGQTFTKDYVYGTGKTVYVKAIYSRLYKASVYIDELSKGAGYFDVEILNEDSRVIDSYYKVTEFLRTLASGNKIRVTAYDYRGYEFSKFTLENTNPADKNIITKTIANEDVSLGLVFVKSDVAIKVKSISKNATIDNLSFDTVRVGDKITISYKIDFSYELKNVYINNVRADKLENVKVDDNSIVIDVTKEFLASLNAQGEIVTKIQTVRDASYISFVIIIPILLVLLAAGASVTAVYFVRSKRKLREIKSNEIMK